MPHPDREFKCRICGEKKTNASYNDVAICADCNPEPFTDNQIDEYISSGGSQCPVCKSDQIEGGSIEVDGIHAWQSVHCLDCGAEWNDVYALSHAERTG